MGRLRRGLLDSVDLQLTPQEQNLYRHHARNLHGSGKVVNPDGSISTIRQATVERNGRVYNIPTVWDGKILSGHEAVVRAGKAGWDKWPSYTSEEEAQAQYDRMHEVMAAETEAYQKRPKHTFIGGQ